MGALDGKVAIVTGAGRGIGRGEAMLLAAEGAKVVVNDLGVAREGDPDGGTPAAEVVSEIEAAGGEAVTSGHDVSSWTGAQELVATAVDRFGGLDILVNNAGILRDAMSFNMSEDDWDSVMRVHLKGHFAPSRFACSYWREQSKANDGAPVNGRIVNTVSESGLFGMAGQANYSAAKAGIASMTLVLAREMKKYGVTVNAVAPRARTRMTTSAEGMDEFMAPKEGEFDEWSPDNVAPLVAFLASDAAADVSGQVFVMWGAHAYLMSGWSLANFLDAGGQRFTIQDLVDRKDELFAPVPRGSKIPQMGFERVSPAWGDLQVDQLRFMAGRDPDEVAYRDLDAGTGLTFAEWDEQSNRLARFLVDQGVAKGDRVSIYLPAEEALRWIVAYAATHKAGAVAVPTNTRLSVPELVTILGHAEVTACITCAPLLDNVLAVQRDVPSLRIVVSAETPDRDDIVDYDRALETDGSDIQVPTSIDDLADIMYTSGTTGLPKGVAVRHRNVAMVPNHEPNWLAAGWIHGAPMFSFAGIAFIYNPMKLGLCGLYLPKFDAVRWLQIVEEEQPIMAFLVPAMAELLVATPELSQHDLSSLRSVSIGSAPLAPGTLLALQERLPDATVSNNYGMTEAGPAFIVMPKDEVTKRVGSVGKPMPPMELEVRREDETECDVREVGEIMTRLPGRQREYYKDDEATASTWTADGWLRSGDLGYVDEDGFLYIAGRKKDLIIRGGNNIYPTDIEAVLLDHPAIQEAAVVGVPHAVLGEDVAAFVVPMPGADYDREAVLAFCAERLADYKRPRQLHLVEELPRNATGKVMKHRLAVPEDARRTAGRPR